MTTRDITINTIHLRLTHNPGSAFVGILRIGRVAGGEIFGYLARLNTNQPTWRVFRSATWPNSSRDLDTISEHAWRFHRDCTEEASTDAR